MPNIFRTFLINHSRESDVSIWATRPAMLFAALMIPAQAPAQEMDGAACRNSPMRVAPCRTIRGRLMLTNGTPSMRIWPVGSRRILGVIHPRTGDGEFVGPLPRAVEGALRTEQWSKRVFADYVVCPLSRERAGRMQMVCIEAARNVVVRRY